MARHYVLGSWANADEFDYSGEQLMGHRQGKSICMDHMLPNGMANLKRYADPTFSEPEPVRKVKPKKSVADSIDLAQKHFDKMEKLSEELDNEYFSGEIDQTRYDLLRYKLDERLIRAWRRVEKENGPIWQKEDREFEENRLAFSLDDVKWNAPAKGKEKSIKALVKTADKSLIKGEGCVSMALKDCKDSNVFLIGYCTIMNIVNKLKEALKCNS